VTGPADFDRMEKLGHSLIQHGPANRRIYVMKADARDMPGLLGRLERLAGANGYTKIFAKVPLGLAAAFKADGYRREAVVPGMFRGREDAAFLGRYFSEERAREREAELIGEILRDAEGRATPRAGALAAGLELRELGPEDAEAMSEVYRAVFPTYPFPIHDPDYLRRTMRTHIRYFGVLEQKSLVAVSSAEMDREELNVEMTDFATLPAARGAGLALHLLRRMEEAVREEGILTPFTIARALSRGMNITFARAGYACGGTLTNNTQISGQIESMNVWYKRWLSAGG